MEILISLFHSALLFLFFLAVAIGGIVCGRKFRDYRNAKQAKEITEESE